MDFDNTAQVDALAKLPAEPVKAAPKWSAWSAPIRAVPAAAAEAMAGAGEVAVAAGRSVIANRDAPRWKGQTQTERETADRQAQAGVTGQNEFSRTLRDVAEHYAPDPATASTAENVVYQLTRGLGKALGYGLTMGPVGIGLFAADEGLTEADRLQRQGVDSATATQAGVVTGLATGAGAFVPVAPLAKGFTLPNVAKVTGLAAVSGPATFAAQQQMTRDILAQANYGEIAKRYDPLDPLGLTLSAVAPWAFGAVSLRGGAKAGKPAPSKPAETSEIAPPVAEPAAPTPAAMPPEALDAAMVQNLTLASDKQRAQAEIPSAGELRPAERLIEQRFAGKLAQDFPAAVAEYNARPDAQGGKVLNTDVARELSPDYMADRTQSAAVHEPASWFVKELYAQKLAELPPDQPVVFTSGGTGAGKTTAISAVPEARAIVDFAGLVYDTNMNRIESAVAKIEQALTSGRQVQIIHVQRDPVDALVNGALPRAMRQEREFGSGRTVPLVEHAKTHVGAAEVIQRLAEKYADNPRVSITVVDNTRGRGGAAVTDLGFVRGFEYTGVEANLHAAAKAEYDAGRISGPVYRATTGDAGEAVGPVPGSTRSPSDQPAVEARPEAVTRALQALDELSASGDTADAFLAKANLPPETRNLVLGLTEAGADTKRAEGMLADFERTTAARPDAAPVDVAADVVEAARAGNFVTPEPATAPKPTDPLARSIADRVQAIEQNMPELKVDDGTTAAEYMAKARREAVEGTADELGMADTDLVRVAAECALMMGAA